MGYGKWIGAVVGFMVQGSLGALAGYIFGSLFDTAAKVNTSESSKTSQGYNSTGSYEKAENGRRNSFLFALMVMASYIIRADGKIMHSEMEYVRRFLRTNFGEVAVAEGQDILYRLFEKRKEMDRIDPTAFSRQIRDCGRQIATNLSYGERLQMLNFLVEIAKCDGHVAQSEIEALREVAQSMGLSQNDVDSMLNLGGNSLDEAYKVLGIAPGVSDEEVRSAYRRLAREHHPDRVASLGDDVRHAAEEKFKQINHAKDVVYQARGMK